MKSVAYTYKNVPIPGGGYATGFLFHPDCPDTLYLRTDIGGTYRFCYEENRWISLSEHVGIQDLSETYPTALAVLPGQNRLLIISGENKEHRPGNGRFCILDEDGTTLVNREIPCFAHGNLNGRGSGFRLTVAAKNTPAGKYTVYYASQKDGLLISRDMGEHWDKRDICGEKHLTFIFVHPNGRTLVAGTAGVDTGDEKKRGHSLYVSYDSGEEFQKLDMPESVFVKESVYSGFVAHRYSFDGSNLYVTMNYTGSGSYVKEMGYSCDCGDMLGGRILRYTFDEEGRFLEWKDITPSVFYKGKEKITASEDTQLDFGFGGIDCAASVKGILAASTFCRKEGDMIFLSEDYGEHWKPVLYDLSIGRMQFHTPYMKPVYNGNRNLIHWLSDIKINPHDPNELWFNSGTGVFVCHSLLAEECCFEDCCRGLEETVHLNVYAPVAGPVRILDIVGDLGGFAFQDQDCPCENSFADENGNRYITCINADFSDLHPETVYVTARGNWTGETKGGLLKSSDYGQSFRRLPLPYQISSYLDERFKDIEKPNVNPGWVALSSDCRHVVYGVAEGIDLFAAGTICSHDGGSTFRKVRIYDSKGEDRSEAHLHFKVFADRVAPELFYGFVDDFRVYVSRDGGEHFYQIDSSGLPKGPYVFGYIDTINKTEIRGEAGKKGVFYLAAGEYGLWKLKFDAAQMQLQAKRLSGEGDEVYRIGLGLLSEGADYLKSDKAVYFNGLIEGKYGFYRSFDDLQTLECISLPGRNFGEINSIDGDCRKFGRFYIATGSFGLKYGEELPEQKLSGKKASEKMPSVEIPPQ